MKLGPLVMTALLALGGVAAADDGPPPPSPFQGQRAPRGELRQLLLQRFDRNHDGRLEPRERQQAARVLRRLARRLSRGDRQANRADAQPQDGRANRSRKFIRRYDRDGDGNVGPGELPPVIANELRPLDQDGDGWLDDSELAP